MTRPTLRHGLRRAIEPFFALTREERQILCLILGLALIGLAAWSWHARRDAATPAGEETPEPLRTGTTRPGR